MNFSELARPFRALLKHLQADKEPPAPVIPDAVSAAHLQAIALDVRRFIAPDWRSLTPGKASAGMCMKSAKFLRNVFEKQDISCEAHLGHFLHNDAWVAHAWVRAGNTIVDITSEQFDKSTLIMTSADDRRYRTEFKHYLLERDADHQVQAWWKDWQKLRLTEIMPQKKIDIANTPLFSVGA